MRMTAKAGAGLPAGRRRLAGPAWLAVVALLINLLLPTALSGVAAQNAPDAGIGFCGGTPANSGSGHTPGAPLRYHCIYCLVAAVGPAPVSPTTPGPPRLLDPAAVVAPTAALPRRHIAFAAAQPRGPPFAL